MTLPLLLLLLVVPACDWCQLACSLGAMAPLLVLSLQERSCLAAAEHYKLLLLLLLPRELHLRVLLLQGGSQKEWPPAATEQQW
jgi:hypothetical protein